jgi:hypothetical protein
MARYEITEQPNGDFLIHLPDGDKIIHAKRDRPDAMPAAAIDAQRYSNHWQPDMVQVSYVIYQRELDNAEISGPYLGQCFALLDPQEETP